MKMRPLFLLALLFGWQAANATDLLEVYQQALTSDTIYQQAISQRLSTKQGVPISVAALLPNLSLAVLPSITRSGFSGAQTAGGIAAVVPVNNTARQYYLTLTATQTVFNYTQIMTVAGSLSLSKAADATLNAALQSLMVRVSSAYFAVLQDEDNLSYSEASKIAYEEQLDQVKQQYDVGLKTITDVYTAQASYDSAVANYIQSQTNLSNDRENLRVITGKYYPHLSSLSDNFPLISPKPMDVEKWVNIAQRQNWSVISSQYNVDNSLQIVKQQFGGHLPTVNVQGTLQRQYVNNINGYGNLEDRTGPSTTTNRELALNINIPLFEGGGVVAATNQAVYNYQIAQQQMEQTIRNTLNSTRQSYLGVIAGISQIDADKQAIKSSISSLDGMEESYKVGTETLVNVLNQQQKVYQAQTQYAKDRYAFVNNILLLKQSADTLSFDDLRAINAWLTDTSNAQVSGSKHMQKNYHHHGKKKNAGKKKVALKHDAKKNLSV